MGFIYKITCSVTNKSYIGQTTTKISERFTGHKKIANKEKRRQIEAANGNEKAKSTKYVSANMLIIKAMIEHGTDKFSIESIEEVKNEELNDKEIFYIKEHNTLHPNGYNLSKGGAVKDKKSLFELQSQIQTEKRSEDFTDFRVHNDELGDLPKYCVYRFYSETNTEGIAINKHPKCPWKFFSFDKHGGMEKTKIFVKEYISKLEAGEEVFERKVKNDDTLPKGISKRKDKIFMVEKTIYGEKYRKGFKFNDTNEDEIRQKAKEYLDECFKDAEEKNKKTPFIPQKTGPKSNTMNVSKPHEENEELENSNVEEVAEEIKSTDSRFIIPKSNDSKNKSSNIKKKGNNNSKFISLEELVKDVELPEEYDEIENVNHQAELGERRSENYPSAVEQVKKFLNLPKVEQERLSSGKSVRTDIKELFNPAPKEKPKLKRRTKKNDNNMNKNNNKIDLSEKKDEIDFDLNE